MARVQTRPPGGLTVITAGSARCGPVRMSVLTAIAAGRHLAFVRRTARLPVDMTVCEDPMRPTSWPRWSTGVPVRGA